MPNTQLIKERMNEKGIQQKDFAEALGIAAPTVSQKINGVRPMNLDEARKIAAMLGIYSGEFGRYFFASEVA
ncbi:MAG: helix-turn-helix transcriptional regulator [Stomatobaculum sp.]|nr:helix-turn-helix transcriptional regulator [Stomatobaculum sp.]